MRLLGIILRLQQDPPIPLSVGEIYEQVIIDDPNTKLTKAGIHRVLKSLIELKLVRFDNPSAHRKKYIADVNTIMKGFEELKSNRIKNLEKQQKKIVEQEKQITALDCGHLSKEFVKEITGRQEEIKSRIVRGVEELHRLVRFNILEKAREGDIVRATLLWVNPFLNETSRNRLIKYFEAAERGADVRYLVSSDVFRIREDSPKRKAALEVSLGIMKYYLDILSRGKKLDGRIYIGPKTYNQISINSENMGLILTENPVTAVWITRQYNPDLIDNAVKTFDRDWEKSKSILELSPEDLKTFGAEGLIKKLFSYYDMEK